MLYERYQQEPRVLTVRNNKHALSLAACWTALGVIGWLAASTTAQAQGNGWITFEKCSVMVEYRVEIPAQERGFLKQLHVELNQSVDAEQLLAGLDTELAELELRMAQLEHSRAEELANDDADVKLQQLALRQVEAELANHRAISNSVSESEIRRLELGVEQAKVGVIRATHVRNRTLSEVKLKAAAVEVAEMRLARRRIVAPRSGVVTLIKIHPGQAVEAGQTILELEDLEHLVVDRLVAISQVNVSDLVGCEVRVDLLQADGQALRLAGKVTSYDPRVSPSGLVRMHARVNNVQHQGNWALLPGSEVTMHVAQPQVGGQSTGQVSRRPAPQAR